MRVRVKAIGAALLAAVSSFAVTTPCRALPPGFVDQLVVGGWDQAVGISFTNDGLGFVWEKGGRVWLLQNGQKSAAPLIDISEEVGNWRDLGLLGFAVHPDFAANGYIYLLYAVDYHHLRHHGTPQYNPAADEYFVDTIGRLTRYTCTFDGGGMPVVDPASRLVLVGESMSTGFPITHESHTIGTLVFGEDGTLLAGNGDGASFSMVDAGGFRVGSSNTALQDGIITPAEDVGAFRAQMPDSLSGKIIRINPATGDGVPGNPFFDPANPRSARSRMWVMGLRNPYRFTLRPGTGGHGGHGVPGHPGTLYIGDVGWNDFEELNIARTGGLNFGWPLFEGLDAHDAYTAASPENLAAPNYLSGQGGCASAFFSFRDLLIQATPLAPSWPNPCDPLQQIDEGTPRFMHERPALEWANTLPARIPAFTGSEATAIELDTPGSPVIGPQFGGKSSLGGVWYTGTAFPGDYSNAYYHADFQRGWIKALFLDEQDNLLEVRPFRDGAGAIVCLTQNPADGGLYYVSFSYTGNSSVRRIISTADAAPVAVASATPAYGPLPLAVDFSPEGSFDPEGEALTYRWDFGDGSPPSSAVSPRHTYTGLVDLTAQGTVIARVFELVPPQPYGGGNHNPEIIRDKDYPPVGSGDSLRQYDTMHDGHQGLDEWIGYAFPEPVIISRLTFQEGKHFYDGGWFEAVGVEYRSNGMWLPVSSLVSTPPYAGNNGVNFETFVFSFQPVVADAIRIAGVPGGLHRFISVAELRVSGLPVGLSDQAPRRYDATLTVSDPAGNTSSTAVVVSAANTPPQVEITSPVDGSRFRMTSSVELPLRATITDAEHAPDELECRWQVILHHNTHSHPEPWIPHCEPTVPLTPVGCDGETYSYEFRLVVTDAHGLETARSSFMHPNCCRPDWDGDGLVNSGDISAFLTSWIASVATGSPVADYDGDGTVNSGDISTFLSGWILALSGGDEFCGPP